MSDMIEVKTSEIEGAALDWAVARGCGMDCEVKRNASGRHYIWRPNPVWDSFSPSTDWSQGGPLIEKYQLRLVPYDAGYFSYTESMPLEEVGTTALIAACRAIVAAKLGDTVSVPAELLNHA